MRRLLGRAALAGAVTLLALGPATVSRADEPVPSPTTTAQPGSATSGTDQVSFCVSALNVVLEGAASSVASSSTLLRSSTTVAPVSSTEPVFLTVSV